MARPLSLQKQAALLNAAVEILAETGLSATTASIAKRAGVAVGTLFTYFPTKEKLFNDVYLMLKTDMAVFFFPDYPRNAEFRTQLWHIWNSYTEWSLRNVDGRRVIRLLAVSDILTQDTVTREQQAFSLANKMFDEAIARSLFVTDSKDFIYAIIQNIADATVDQIQKEPDKKDVLLQLGFRMMWAAVSVKNI